MPLIQDLMNLSCNINTIIFQPTRTMEMNIQDKEFPANLFTATWGAVLVDAADFHPVTGCLKGLTTSGSAGHYQA